MKLKIRLLALLLVSFSISACSSGEYKLESTQGKEYTPYETWNTLPKNS